MALTDGRILCDVCGGSTFSYTDMHMEGYCVKCGAPHMLAYEHKGECNLTDEFVTALREYHTETGLCCNLGCYLGDPGEQIRAQLRAFDEWLKLKHPELIQPAGTDQE